MTLFATSIAVGFEFLVLLSS